MFGGVLSKLLGKSGSKIASQGGDDILSRVVSNYGDDITRKLSSSYGDDTSQPILSSLVSAPTSNVSSKSGGVLSQLKSGVSTPRSVNPNIADNLAVEGATDMALRSNKGAAAKVSNVGKNMEEAGTKLKNNQIIGTVRDRKLLERSPDAIKWADKYGFSPNQYEDVSNILTGGEGVLSNFNNNALKNAKRSVLMPDSARESALKAVDKAITLKPHVKKNLKRAINDSYDVTTGNMGNRLAERGEKRAVVMGEADIFDMHKTVQDIEKMAYEVTGKGSDDAQRILRNYAGDLKKTINETAQEIYQNPDNIQELTAALEGANLSPQLNKDIIDSIRKGTDYLGIRSMQSPAVTLGKVAEQGKIAPLAGGVGGQANGLFANPLMQVANEAVGKPIASGTGKALQAGGRALQVAGKGGAPGGGAPGGGSDLVKYGAGALGGYGLLNMLTNDGGTDPSMSMSALAGGQDQNDPMSMMMNGGAQQEQEPTVGGYSRTQLEDAYVAALMGGDTEAADAIGSMIGMLDNTEKRSADTKTAGSNAKAQNAINAMNNGMSVYEQGGGAQGPIGALGNLLNKATFGAYNPNQAAYEDMLQAASVAVARANGEVGILSNQDIENYRKMLPTFSDNPKQAQIKLQMIMSSLQSME